MEEELKGFSVLGYKVSLLSDLVEEAQLEIEGDFVNFIGFEIDDSYVELEGPVWKLDYKDEEIFIREGAWFEKDDDGIFAPDWSLSWFYKDENNPADYLYFEQDPIETAVYNFIRGYDINPDLVGNK